MITIGLLYYYLGSYKFIGFVAYLAPLIKLVQRGFRMPFDVPFILVSLFAALIITKGFLEVGIASLFYGRVFWGFLAFLLFFSLTETNLLNLARILALVAIFEYVSIQYDSNLLFLFGNYISPDSAYHFYEAAGFQAGAYGFGGNRTVTSCVFLAWFAYLSSQDRFERNLGRPTSNMHQYDKILFLFGIMATFSATASLLLFFFLVVTLVKSRNPAITLSLLFLLLAAGVSLLLSNYVRRFSLDYIIFIIDYKYHQVLDAVPLVTATPFLGKFQFATESIAIPNYGVTFSEFALLEFVVNNGLIGFLVFVWLVFSKLNRKNFWPIIIICISNLHYGLIFSLPGQIMFGYFLSMSGKQK